MHRRNLLAWVPAWLAFGSPPAFATGRERRRRAPRQTGLPLAAPAAPRPVIPPIDGPPPPSRIPGLEPAPVPARNLGPPIADNQPRPSVALGIPTPPPIQQGQSFYQDDPSPDTRPATGGGLRLPSPGATLRLPF